MGVEAWQVASYISDFFQVNIIISDELKNKLMNAKIKTKSLNSVLNTFAWLINCDYVYKDNCYFFGGKSITYNVLPSNGYTDAIRSNFPDSISVIDDKFIVKGSEKDVKNITETLKHITERETLNCWIYIVQLTTLRQKNVGANIQPTIRAKPISFDMLKNQTVTFDKIFGESTIEFSIKNEFKVTKTDILINSSLNCMSGQTSVINQGKQQDRPIYTSAPAGGQTSNFVSGYQSYYSGLILKLTPFKCKDHWIIQTDLEHSRFDSELVKTLVKINSNVIVKDDKSVFLGIINTDSSIKSKGGILSGFAFMDWMTPTQDEYEITQIYVYLACDLPSVETNPVSE